MAQKDDKRPVGPSASPEPRLRTERSTPAVPESGSETAAESAAPRPTLELTFEEKGLKAVIPAIYPQTSTEDVLELLRRHGVSTGFSKAVLRRAVETARESGQTLRDVVVAQGRPPRPSPPPRLEYCPPKGLDTLPPLEPVGRLLALRDHHAVAEESASLRAWAVKPGERLAVEIFPEGTTGVDVRGKPIPPLYRGAEGGEMDRLQPGSGVERDVHGFDYLASIYGYAGLENYQVSVLAPIWISADGMQACFLNLPRFPGSSAPSMDDLNALLEFSDVTAGIDAEAVEGLCQSLADARHKETLIPLARGRPAVPPQNALPTFTFNYEARVGTIRRDGSIDFRERNLFPSVQQDELLLECGFPVPGNPGQTVRGAEIPVAAPIDAEIIAGENVRQETAEDGRRLYATIEGGVSVKTLAIKGPAGTVKSTQYNVAVLPVFQLAGDVDNRTGNIDFQGNVVIGGTVNSGFQVKATGDIAIGSSIEPGARVQAGGDLTVQQGIVGLETRVETGGTVTAKFIHEARVKAAADVVAGSYVHGAFVQAGGRVQVEGMGGSGGGIIGGETWAVEGIASRNVGSQSSRGTMIFAGLEPEQLTRLEKLKQAVRQTEIVLQKLLKATGLPTLDIEEIRKLVARHPDRKSAILHYVKKTNQIAQMHEAKLEEQHGLSEQIVQASREARIEIPEQAFARVKLRIGEHQLALPQDLKYVCFRLDPEDDQSGIIWKDLA